jgi:serine/threonine protein kinase
MIGKTYGHYEIIQKIGKGGMGEVYKARDTRLDREVAIKILPEETAADSDRLKRFEREAKAVAALKHPNIVTVYSVEEIDGRYCLTMELVDGKTLSELIPQGGLSLERFFEMAIPLAHALVAAHAKGITHRDLKPSNVMVDADGTLKVLDFGLAKLLPAPDGSEEATVVGEDSVTGEGRVLGTVYYMSPEQAEAKPLDHRSDIFSLGVVLYEMATGKRPFAGDTPISTISSILKETPPQVTEVRDNLPRHLARMINRCIEKKPNRRFQTARDVANELEGLEKEVQSGDHDQAITGSTSRSDLDLPQRKRRKPIVLIAGVFVIAMAAFLAYFVFGNRSGSEPPREVTTRPMTGMVGMEIAGSWSPDGGFFAYAHSMAGPVDIFVVSATGGDAIRLVESPYDDIHPRWSPDNRWVAFVSNRDNKSGIYIIPPLGGQVQKIVETREPPLSGVNYRTLGSNPWSPDGRTLLFAKSNDEGILSIWSIELESRKETQLVTPGAGERDGSPSYSFEGDKIVFNRSDNAGARLMVMPVSGGEPKEVLREDEAHLMPSWAPGGKTIVYSRESGGVYVVDVGGGRVRQLTTGDMEGAPIVARDGRILFSTFSHQTDLYLQDVDGSSAERLTFHTQDNFGARLSPDGTRVVYASSRTGDGEIWLIDRGTGKERRLISRGSEDWSPDWSPDGHEIVFISYHEGLPGLWVVSADGGALRKLGDHQPMSNPHWAPDGSAIGFVAETETGPALFVTGPKGETTRKVLDGVRAFEWYLDATRIVYDWRDGARMEMRVANLETGEEAVLLDTPFGELAVSPDGASVSYLSALSHFNMNLHVLLLKPPGSPGGLPTPDGQPRAITRGDGEWHVHNGGWSPDSKQVIYTRDTDTGDIYLLEGAM